MMEDSRTGQRYLEVKHFLTRGIPASIVTFVVIVTVGYGWLLDSKISGVLDRLGAYGWKGSGGEMCGYEGGVKCLGEHGMEIIALLPLYLVLFLSLRLPMHISLFTLHRGILFPELSYGVLCGRARVCRSQ
jgi:hypothetical protein